ncbi:MAG: YfcE family phosphodiesterase [Dehalococcoidia bacterium]|nr:YfcE family phosphodiesterase [Dehalococcoidia bacterium]
MTSIVVVGDTHVRKWEELDERLRRLVERADIAIHCGDWVHLDVVDGFRGAARRSVVVHGNSDPPDLRRALPYREVIEVDGVRIGVTHPAWGGPEFPARELLPDFPADLFGRVDLVCYGHIHVPSIEEVEGVRFVNPGQGYPSFMVPGTYATIEVARGEARVELCEFAGAL